jgi:hypothetical protein
MKRARVLPFLGKTIIHPGAVEAWFARVDDRLNTGNNGLDAVSKKKPSSAVSGKSSRVEEIRHEQ